ncbi:hypothetical protein ABKN59_007230 [Abortiporus biennis]
MSQHSSAMLSSLIVYVRHFIHFVRTPNIQPPIHMICFVTMEFPTRPESFSGVGKRAKPCKRDFVTKEMRNLLTSSTSTPTEQVAYNCSRLLVLGDEHIPAVSGPRLQIPEETSRFFVELDGQSAISCVMHQLVPTACLVNTD